MKNKKIIFILVIISIIILIIFVKNKMNKTENETTENINIEKIQEEVKLLEYVQTLEDGTLKNNSEKLKENKEFGGLEIKRILITGKDNEATMVIDIQNISTQVKEDKEVTLIMKDKDGNEIGKMGVNILKLQPKQASTLEFKMSLNFINTYDFEILDKKLALE